MDLNSHKIFISQDVVFHESIFPFYNSDFASTFTSFLDNFVLPTHVSTSHTALDNTESLFPPDNALFHCPPDNILPVSNEDASFPLNASFYILIHHLLDLTYLLILMHPLPMLPITILKILLLYLYLHLLL
jgi:hypothetical protein